MDNLFQFPKIIDDQPPRQISIATPPASDIVRLFDGEVKVYKRAEYAKDNWQYSIKTKVGLERRSTNTSNLDEAIATATARYHEIHWREGRGLSTRACTFEQAAESLLAEMRRRASIDASRKHSNLDMNSNIITNHMIPFFTKALATITEDDVHAYHAVYLANWHANQKPGKIGPSKPTARSMNSHEALFKQVVTHAVEKKLIQPNEAPQLHMTKATSRRVRDGFTEDEMQRLLAHLKTRSPGRSNARHEYAREMAYHWSAPLRVDRLGEMD